MTEGAFVGKFSHLCSLQDSDDPNTVLFIFHGDSDSYEVALTSAVLSACNRFFYSATFLTLVFTMKV